MADRVIKVCDACGKTSSPRLEVYRFDAKFSDGTRVVGDLCDRCRRKMSKDFGLEHTSRYRRSAFNVVNYEDIPRTS